jgi:uncharacterized membrane protein YeaQ/YmgE (transglycosylase-associated protein family)
MKLLQSFTCLQRKIERNFLKGGENIMDVLLWIVFGAIAGWIASVIMKTNAEQGLLMDIILGIVGAAVGGFLMNLFGQPGATGFNIYSLVVAVVGAVVLIWIGRALSGTRY